MNYSTSRETKQDREVMRTELLRQIDVLKEEWSVQDGWMTRDTYQDGTHADIAQNKKRNTWFMLVFDAVSRALSSGFLTKEVSDELRHAQQEVESLWKTVQAEGFEQFCQDVVPELQTELHEIGISISDQQAGLIAVQLAKDPSGHVASQTLLTMCEAVPFETKDVEINAKFGITQRQAPELTSRLASFSASHDIEATRELLGNSESVVRAAESLLDLIRVGLARDVGEAYESSISYT